MLRQLTNIILVVCPELNVLYCSLISGSQLHACAKSDLYNSNKAIGYHPKTFITTSDLISQGYLLAKNKS